MITGGTGLVGSTLSHYLTGKGHSVIVLTRKLPVKKREAGKTEYALWDVNKGYIDLIALQRADYIIHLAGAGVMEKKWTEAYKKEIIDSRVQSGKLIATSLAQTPNKVKAVISASAIGYYGADKNPVVPFTESDPADKSFLGETCRLWEEAVQSVEELNKRLVTFRIGIVLSKDGGALKEFMQPLKFRVATILGNQIISWIHIDDLCSMFLYAIENESMTGMYNAVAPQPVSNKNLIKTLARKMKGKFYLPVHVPAFILKLMLGARSIEILKSATVSSKKIEAAGFIFQYDDLETALDNLIKE